MISSTRSVAACDRPASRSRIVRTCSATRVGGSPRTTQINYAMDEWSQIGNIDETAMCGGRSSLISGAGNVWELVPQPHG